MPSFRSGCMYHDAEHEKSDPDRQSGPVPKLSGLVNVKGVNLLILREFQVESRVKSAD